MSSGNAEGNALNDISDSDDEFDDAKLKPYEDMKTSIKPPSTSLIKVLSFLEDYAKEGVLNEGVGSNKIKDAITTVNETYGFVDSYPPLSEKLAIIKDKREGYRLLLTGYNPLEIEKEKFDALVNGSYSDRLMSDKDASFYYAYRDGLKVIEEDMAAAAAAATMIQKHFRDYRKRNMNDSLWTIS